MMEMETIKNAQRLYHIVEAVARIRRSLTGVTRERFFADEDKQGNVVRCIEIIGEAANHLPDDITALAPEVPWPAVVAMRNNLIHGYNEVNYSFVWEVVERDLEIIGSAAKRLLQNLELPQDFVMPKLP